MPFYRQKPAVVEAVRVLESDPRDDNVLPGSWYLKTESGAQLCLTDEAFRKGFEPVNGEAAKYMVKTEQFLPGRDIIPFPGVEQVVKPPKQSIASKLITALRQKHES